MTLSQFCAILYDLCLAHGGSVTSWLRTSKHNAAVGGKPNSRHLDGYAMDVVLDDPKTAPAFKSEVNKAGLTFVDEGDHIHVQIPPRH